MNETSLYLLFNIDISLEITRLSDEIKLYFTGLTFPLEIKCINTSWIGLNNLLFKFGAEKVPLPTFSCF